MGFSENFKKQSFLIYGLGSTGKSVVKFFEKNDFKKYLVWDDKYKNLYKRKRAKNLSKALSEVSYIILSPGISLEKSKNKKILRKFKNKIITDLDLVFVLKNFFKSVVVTGTNGKSTTCKILAHIFNKNNFQTKLGGNIGTPVLDLKINQNSLLIIEASSFQLSYSKFICPDYALLLNISNDHLDWHGSMKNYTNAKFKIFENQNNKQFSLVNNKLKTKFKKRKLSGKLITPKIINYRKLKSRIKNSYINSNINDENMSFIYEITKLFKIRKKFFLKSLRSFVGLPHRYETFLKKKDYTFINDSKATSFHSTKFALGNTKNIYWIVGGLPKKNDIISLKNLKKNIIRSYIIGKNISFFKKQIKDKVSFKITKTLKNSIIQILKDIKILKTKNNNILLSPASASFDQYSNFEKRGDEFKKLSKHYARKYI